MPGRTAFFVLRDCESMAAAVFRDSSLRHRLDAIIAHEYEEHRNGMDHEAAVKVARDTKLPISSRARRILEEMRKGWKGR